MYGNHGWCREPLKHKEERRLNQTAMEAARNKELMKKLNDNFKHQKLRIPH